MRRAAFNPKRGDTYDIADEQIRAQGQAIYESYVMRQLGKKHFRDLRTGRRIDADLPPDQVRAMVAAYMFAAGTRVGQRTGFIAEGSRKGTAKAVLRSTERAQPAWADKLLRNRQDYEETIALARKGPFYRVVPERTAVGLRYFVWPMPPGAEVPGPGLTARLANLAAAKLNVERDPRVTGVWWTPPRLAYTPERLAHWLPPQPAEASKRRKVG